MAIAFHDPVSVRPASAIALKTRLHGVEQRQLLLSLTGEMSDRIDDLAERTGYDIGELINIAMAILRLSINAVEQGKQVGVAAEDQE